MAVRANAAGTSTDEVPMVQPSKHWLEKHKDHERYADDRVRFRHVFVNDAPVQAETEADCEYYPGEHLDTGMDPNKRWKVTDTDENSTEREEQDEGNGCKNTV